MSATLRRHSVFLLAMSIFCVTASANGVLESRYFRASDNVRLHYLEAGRGPTLLFVPGWTMPADIWEPQLRYFATSYRVIAFDPRGQGKSSVARYGYVAERRARDIGELIQRLGEPVVLVSWSLGVLESLKYIDMTGTRSLRALVMVDSSIGEEPKPEYDPGFMKRLRSQRAEATEEFVRAMYKTPQDEAYLRRILDGALRMPQKSSLALLRYPYPREYWKGIVYRVDRPILYAVGAHLAGQAENLKKNRPEAWVQVFENAGHALFVDEADAFNQLLADFLAKEVFVDSAATRR